MRTLTEPRVLLPARRCILVLILPAVLLVLAGCERAKETPVDSDRVALQANEHQNQFGDYTLHINALTTDQLPQEVAKEYRIARSNSRAMLNVVITKKAVVGDEPVTGRVTANAKNPGRSVQGTEHA